MNYIEKIQNLKNKELKTLILSGNHITQLENLYHLKKTPKPRNGKESS